MEELPSTIIERKEITTTILETPILAADSAEPPFHQEIPVVVREEAHKMAVSR